MSIKLYSTIISLLMLCIVLQNCQPKRSQQENKDASFQEFSDYLSSEEQLLEVLEHSRYNNNFSRLSDTFSFEGLKHLSPLFCSTIKKDPHLVSDYQIKSSAVNNFEDLIYSDDKFSFYRNKYKIIKPFLSVNVYFSLVSKLRVDFINKVITKDQAILMLYSINLYYFDFMINTNNSLSCPQEKLKEFETNSISSFYASSNSGYITYLGDNDCDNLLENSKIQLFLKDIKSGEEHLISTPFTINVGWLDSTNLLLVRTNEDQTEPLFFKYNVLTHEEKWLKEFSFLNGIYSLFNVKLLGKDMVCVISDSIYKINTQTLEQSPLFLANFGDINFSSINLNTNSGVYYFVNKLGEKWQVVESLNFEPLFESKNEIITLYLNPYNNKLFFTQKEQEKVILNEFNFKTKHIQEVHSFSENVDVNHIVAVSKTKLILSVSCPSSFINSKKRLDNCKKNNSKDESNSLLVELNL